MVTSNPRVKTRCESAQETPVFVNLNSSRAPAPGLQLQGSSHKASESWIEAD